MDPNLKLNFENVLCTFLCLFSIANKGIVYFEIRLEREIHVRIEWSTPFNYSIISISHRSLTKRMPFEIHIVIFQHFYLHFTRFYTI